MTSIQTGWKRLTFIPETYDYRTSPYMLFEQILFDMRERYRGEGRAALEAWTEWLKPYSKRVLIQADWQKAVPPDMRQHLIHELKSWFHHVGFNYALYASPTHLPLLRNDKAWPLMSYLTKYGNLKSGNSPPPPDPPPKPAFFVRNPRTGVEVLRGPDDEVIEEIAPTDNGYSVVIPLRPSPPGGSPAHQPGARSLSQEWHPEYDDFFDRRDKESSHSPHSLAHVRVPFGFRQRAVYRMAQPRLG